MGEKSIAWAIRRNLNNGGSRRRRARLVYGFAALISLATFVLFWCTNVFRDAILSNLELRNGTPTFLMWQRPPVGLRVNVYVFNYTNVHEFESGNASKLKVQEVGPFVYREKFSRANVRLDENRTVTYQEERSFQWIAGKSESQRVIVPNVLLMSTLAYSRDLNYLLQIGFTMLLAGLKLRAKPFLELPAGEFFWGYEDELFEMGKRFLPSRKFLPHDKFGILAFVRIHLRLCGTTAVRYAVCRLCVCCYPRRVAEKRLERGSHHDAHGNRRSSQSRAHPANQWTRKSSSVGRRGMRPNLRYRRQHVPTGLDRAAKRHALRLRERVLQAIAVSLRASQLLQRYSHFKVSSYRCSIRFLPGRMKNPYLLPIRKQTRRRSIYLSIVASSVQ